MSLLSGLKQNVSLIQGPPGMLLFFAKQYRSINMNLGTGKSFIGALLAKFILDFSDQKILVVCYTNHALDQFLEDLLDIGIPIEDMVRLGAQSTPRTGPMALNKQTRTHRFRRGDYTILDELKADIEIRAASLTGSFKKYHQSTIRNDDLLAHLEFDEPDFYDAFQSSCF